MAVRDGKALPKEYLHDLWTIARQYRLQRARDITAVAADLDSLDSFRQRMYNPRAALSPDQLLSGQAALTRDEILLLWPYVGESTWQWKETIWTKEAFRRRHHFECPANLACPTLLAIAVRRSKAIEKGDIAEDRRLAQLLADYKLQNPQGTHTRCPAEIHIVERRSSPARDAITGGYAELNTFKPHTCSLAALELRAWSMPLMDHVRASTQRTLGHGMPVAASAQGAVGPSAQIRSITQPVSSSLVQGQPTAQPTASSMIALAARATTRGNVTDTATTAPTNSGTRGGPIGSTVAILGAVPVVASQTTIAIQDVISSTSIGSSFINAADLPSSDLGQQLSIQIEGRALRLHATFRAIRHAIDLGNLFDTVDFTFESGTGASLLQHRLPLDATLMPSAPRGLMKYFSHGSTATNDNANPPNTSTASHSQSSSGGKAAQRNSSMVMPNESSEAGVDTSDAPLDAILLAAQGDPASAEVTLNSATVGTDQEGVMMTSTVQPEDQHVDTTLPKNSGILQSGSPPWPEISDHSDSDDYCNHEPTATQNTSDHIPTSTPASSPPLQCSHDAFDDEMVIEQARPLVAAHHPIANGVRPSNPCIAARTTTYSISVPNHAQGTTCVEQALNVSTVPTIATSACEASGGVIARPHQPQALTSVDLESIDITSDMPHVDNAANAADAYRGTLDSPAKHVSFQEPLSTPRVDTQHDWVDASVYNGGGASCAIEMAPDSPASSQHRPALQPVTPNPKVRPAATPRRRTKSASKLPKGTSKASLTKASAKPSAKIAPQASSNATPKTKLLRQPSVSDMLTWALTTSSGQKRRRLDDTIGPDSP
ncbi:hypothetical protein B0A48_07425 [Cryoendolithus antarcticus]|uniref:Uncharacterized protein n=1 Tax=Cryoendolithus antarcticus TaxID=1507870 RepID=A0A1V8T918_9PEZI|nr:hypothetical protein B0A48_07425 [Cryoendolithus antarcticus]